MHDDYHCYWAPKSGDQHTVTNYTKEPTEWMKPSTNDNEKSDIVVVPGAHSNSNFDGIMRECL